MIAAIVILVLAAGSFYFFPMLTMSPTETGQIGNTGIYSAKNAINSVFFIKTNNGWIMIDAGSNINMLEAALRQFSINTKDVKWILLTHSDSDHTTALTLFPNAEIYMNEDEFPLINGFVKRNSFSSNSMPSGVRTDKIIPLKNNQELVFEGTNVRCIKTPGHTPGSMSYLFDSRYLFTGDAFRFSNGKITVHPFTMDSDLAKKTAEQLKETINSSLIVLSAHYGLLNK